MGDTKEIWGRLVEASVTEEERKTELAQRAHSLEHREAELFLTGFLAGILFMLLFTDGWIHRVGGGK
jgi:hypothetical protein